MLPTSLKIYLAIIVLIVLSLIVMVFLKRTRRVALVSLAIISAAAIGSGIYFFKPKHYEKRYLSKSAEWRDLGLRALADSAHFFIGAIPGGVEITDPIFKNNFNSVTLENALKMGPLFKNGEVGNYDFSAADKLVDEGLANNMRVRGHTLVWGKQSDLFKNPDLNVWLNTFPEDERSDKLRNLMLTHIDTVLSHFKGRIKIWDCVNEVTDFMEAGKLEDNVYSRYLTHAYIADAFKHAHKVDPDLKLFLNEQINEYQGKQAELFLHLVKKLKADQVPIHGVGIQSHIMFNQDTAIASLHNFVNKLADLGLEVEITEVDLRLRLFDGDQDPYAAQGKYYGRLVKMCMSNPACKGVTFWGSTDKYCWMDGMPIFAKPNEPYLFDAEQNPKPGLYEIYHVLAAGKE